MDEYIKRDAVLTTIWATSAEYDLFFPVLILNAIKAIPAADVRPVVTCIECKHSCDMPGGLRCCHGTCVDCYVEPEFFCAEGEKEESDTKERAGASPAPTDRISLGDTVWMKYYDDDLKREEIDEVRVTGLGYEGFWYSGSPDQPRAMDALVRWERFGVDAFFSREEAEG